MTRLVVLSDTHGLHSQINVPNGDVLIHCGDCTSDGSELALRDFLRWFSLLPHRGKCLVVGNHDWIFEKDPGLARMVMQELCPWIHYLQDSGCTIEGRKFYGSPVSPRFYDWAFNRDRGEQIRKHWDLIPDDTDVLITHGPMFGHLDRSRKDGDHLGCRDLYEAVLRVQPEVHCCGHIHGGYGTSQLVHDDGRKTVLINAACCNENYAPRNKPFIFDL